VSTVLTIDLGTSGPKAAVIDAAGRVLGSARATVTTRFGPDGAAEQDPVEVWQATVNACRRALHAAVQPALQTGSDPVCDAVICSSQYSSVVAVDAAGVATRPMLLWMDQRASPRRLRALGAPRANPLHVADWFRRNGLAPIDAGITLNHIRWVQHAEPDVYASTASFLEPMDYLTLRLSGRATANPCTALMYLLTDNRSPTPDRWDPTLVGRAGIDAAKLPELVPAGSDVGPMLPDVAEALGMSPTTRVLSGLNDTQAGALAAGAATGNRAALSLGTTAVIAARCDRHRADPRTTIFSSVGPCATPGAGYLMSAENGVAGGALEHFTRLLYEGPDYDALDADVAGAPAGAGGLLYLPWVRGSLAPAADGKMRGGFLNLGLEHARPHLARSVLEGIALNLARLRGPAERFAGRTFGEFSAYGGGAQSDRWCQIHADVLGAPVHQLAQPGHANCVGLGLYAFARLGRCDPDQIGTRVPVRRVYEPDPANAAVYAELGARLADAFKATKPMFHEFHEARHLFRPTAAKGSR
jgi:xylulokinase